MIHVFYTKRSQEEDYEFKENLVSKKFLMTLLSSKKKKKALLNEHHCLNSTVKQDFIIMLKVIGYYFVAALDGLSLPGSSIRYGSCRT